MPACLACACLCPQTHPRGEKRRKRQDDDEDDGEAAVPQDVSARILREARAQQEELDAEAADADAAARGMPAQASD